MQEEISNEELEHNKNLYEEALALEFPDEDMKDKDFRDNVFKTEHHIIKKNNIRIKNLR